MSITSINSLSTEDVYNRVQAFAENNIIQNKNTVGFKKILNKNSIIDKDGINIALKNSDISNVDAIKISSKSEEINLRDDARLMDAAKAYEKDMISFFWETIFAEMDSVNFFGDDDVSDILWKSEYVRELVNKIYDDDGGQISQLLYEQRKRRQ